MNQHEGKIVADLLNEAFTSGKLYLEPRRRKTEVGEEARLELWVKLAGVHIPLASKPIPDSFPMLLKEVGT